MGDEMSEFVKSIAKHLIWGIVTIVVACLSIIAFGDPKQAEIAGGVLLGLGVLLFAAGFGIWCGWMG